MNFNVVNFNFQMEEMAERLKAFCKTHASSENHNYMLCNYQDHKESLFYHLYISKRLQPPNGIFNLVCLNKDIVGIGGAYIFDHQKKIVIIGVRTLVHKKYRGVYLPGKTLLPYQCEWAKKINANMILLSFNEKNKWIYDSLGKIESRNRPPLLGTTMPSIYKNFKAIKMPLYIQHTLQWTLCWPLNNNINEEQLLRDYGNEK